MRRNSGLPPATAGKFSLDPLDPKFVASKPRQELDEERALQLEREGNLIITRKRDGYGHLTAITKNRIRIYTAGINDVTDHYPHIVEEIRKMQFPDDTLLRNEIFVSPKDTDDFSLFASIAKSSAEKAIEIQNTMPASCMIFDIIVLEGKIFTGKAFKERLRFINAHFPEDDDDLKLKFVIPVEVLPIPLLVAQKDASLHKYEGIVGYDANGTTEYRLDGGDPPRPKVCWKWKPLKEDDFIVREKIFVKEGSKKRFKEVELTQIDAKTGEEFYCGKLGSFTKEMKEFLAKAKLPIVMQVQFMSRHASRKLREPRFMRLRDDKKPKECIYNPE